MSTLAGSLAVLLLAATVQAQQPPVPPPPPLPLSAAPGPPGTAAPEAVPIVPELPPRRPYGLEAESLPSEIAEDRVRDVTGPPQFGPTPVADVRFLMDHLGLAKVFGDSGIRTFGWVEGGYTYGTPGSGQFAVQPRQNRYSDQFLLNQLGLVIQKPLKQDRFDWGFNVRYFAGADAALGQPKGGINDPPGNPRFGQDFRDLNVDFHLPILTEGGVNVKIGRMNSIIGWNGFLAPYRPLYSSDYQFFYSQDGAFTGALAQFVVSDQLDVWSGVTLGANTFFEKRSPNSICYIGQVNYWLTTEQRTRLTASVYTGPNAIFAAPGLAGTYNTTVELRVQQNWSERFTQVVQSNMGWDSKTPVGTGSWYGLYTVGILHVTKEWDVIGRAEWFRDVRGTRTGVDTSYSEVTLGANWHPTAYLEVRPEIRGDFAGKPAFGVNGLHNDRSQLSLAISALLKF